MDFQSLRRKDFRFLMEMEPRWRDMDGLRHINHATYLSLMETVRIQYLDQLGLKVNKWEEEESSILASMKIDYFQQSTYPNKYEIGVRVIRVGNKSFDILSILFEKNNILPVVSGVFTIVAFNYIEQTTLSVPDSIREELSPL